MKQIGQILLWVGFLSGSLATVFNLPGKAVEQLKSMTPDDAAKARFELPDLSEVEVEEDGWHLIPWTWYIASAGICGVGVALMTVSRRSEGGQNATTKADLKEMQRALEELIVDTGRLETLIEQVPPSKLTASIDDELADNFRIFADARDSITAEYGLPVFAEVMTQFAAGERALNRAWSASADGYLDEAAACVQRGLQCLESARDELARAARNSD